MTSNVGVHRPRPCGSAPGRSSTSAWSASAARAATPPSGAGRRSRRPPGTDRGDLPRLPSLRRCWWPGACRQKFPMVATVRPRIARHLGEVAPLLLQQYRASDPALNTNTWRSGRGLMRLVSAGTHRPGAVTINQHVDPQRGITHRLHACSSIEVSDQEAAPDRIVEMIANRWIQIRCSRRSRSKNRPSAAARHGQCPPTPSAAPRSHAIARIAVPPLEPAQRDPSVGRSPRATKLPCRDRGWSGPGPGRPPSPALEA